MMKYLKRITVSSCLFIIISLTLNAQSYNMLYQSKLDINADSGWIYDNGGQDGNYMDNSDDTLVIYPETNGKYIQLIFRKFIQTSPDLLYVYDGPSTGSPLIGSYYINPGAVFSTDPSGALTLRFNSDGSANLEGFEVEISVNNTIVESDFIVLSSNTSYGIVTAGDLVYFEGEVQNIGSSYQNSMYIHYYLSTDSEYDSSDGFLGSEKLNPVLPDNKVSFDGPMRIPPNTESGNYYLVGRILDIDGNDANYLMNGFFANPITVKAAEVDLIISKLQVPDISLSPKSDFRLNYTIKNIGNTLSAPTNVGVYLSKDLVPDSNDVLLGKSYCYSINANSYIDQYFISTILSDIESGIYYLILQADCDSIISEFSESNNLQINQVIFDNSDEFEFKFSLNSISSLTDTIMNNNTLRTEYTIETNAKLSNVKFNVYMSKDSILEPDDLLLADYDFGSYNFIEEGISNRSTNINISLQESVIDKYSGNNYLIGKIYHDFLDDEKSDDIAFTELYIGGNSYFDFSMSTCNISSDSITTDGTSGISCYIKNQGTTRSPATRIGYFVSSDTIFDSNDRFLGSDYVEGLDPQRTSGESFSINTQDLAIGQNYILCVIDYETLLEEEDEDNNIYVLPIKVIDLSTIQGYDIHLLDISFPDTLKESEECEIGYEYFYNSTLNEYISFGCYLSRDSILDSEDLNHELFSNELYTRGYSVMDYKNTIKVPWIGESGKYFIIIKADSHNILFEDDESNNVVIRSVYVLKADKSVDLKISELEVDEPLLFPNGEIRGKFLYENIGEIEADTVIVQAFISRYSEKDIPQISVWKDTLYNVDATTRSVDFQVLLPDTISVGLKLFWMNLSIPDEESESNTSNNTESQLVVIQNPDLDYELSNVSLNNVSVYQSESLFLTYTLIHHGTTQSQGPIVSWYLSEDNQFSTDDRELKSEKIEFFGIQDSAIFVSAVYFPEDIEPGIFNLITVVDGLDVIPENSEENNYWKDVIEVKEKGENLVISKLSLSQDTLSFYESVEINYTVGNTGNLNSNSFYLGLYLSSDTLWDENDLAITNKYVSSLYGGQEQDFQFSYTLSRYTQIDTGSYYIICKADITEIIQEKSEEDNTNFIELSILASNFDLEIIELGSASDTLYSVIGLVSKYECKIVNRGLNLFTGKVRVLKYISTDTIFNPIEDIYTGLEEMNSSIYPNDTTVIFVSLEAPSKYANDKFTYFLKLESESFNEEYNMDNNLFSIPIKLIPSNIDLVIKSLSIITSPISLNSYLECSVTVVNQGLTTTNTEVSCRYFLSTDTVYQLGDQELTNYWLPPIDGQSEYSNLFFIYISSNTEPGDYYMLCIADYNENHIETNETNNTGYVQLRVEAVPIDLIIQNPSIGKQEAGIGEMISLSCQVYNSGLVSTSKSSYLGYYLSSDSILDVSDNLLGTDYVGYLGSGGGSSESMSFYIPELESGNYFILFVADYLDGVNEINENNNMAYLPLKVNGIELIVDYTIYGTHTFTADSAFMDLTIKNIGNLPATQEISYQVVFSDDPFINTNDTIISEQLINPLGIGEEVRLNIDLKLPEGNYIYLIIGVDEEDLLVESNELNNTYQAQIVKPFIPFDISVSAPFEIRNAIPGEEIDVNIIIDYQGECVFDSTWVLYYFSNQGFINETSRLIGEVKIPILFGEVQDYNHRLMIPEDIDPGSYALIVHVEMDSSWIEADSSNNTAIIYYQIDTKTGNFTKEVNEFLIYPNPTNDFIYVKSVAIIRKFRIIDNLGKIISNGLFDNNQQMINVQDYQSGIYYIILEFDDSIEMMKFGVVH